MKKRIILLTSVLVILCLIFFWSPSTDKMTSYFYGSLGDVLFKQGYYDKAILLYSKSLRLDQNNVDFIINRGLSWFHKKDFDQAIIDFTNAIQKRPNNADLYSKRGHLLTHKKDYDRAIKDFSMAIKLKPNVAKLFTDRGILLILGTVIQFNFFLPLFML